MEFVSGSKNISIVEPTKRAEQKVSHPYTLSSWSSTVIVFFLFFMALQGHSELETESHLRFQTTSKGILNVKLCVLDCDGIIFNSNQLKTQAYANTLSALGYDEEQVAQFVQLHLHDVSVSRFHKFTHFFRDLLKDPEYETKTNKALELYSDSCLKLYETLTPEPGALAFVAKSPTSPDKTYVISGGAQTELNDVFQHHNILDKFNQICGSPTTKIEHLSKILKDTKIDPNDVLFIGDGWTDFKTSKALGCHFCFLEAMSDWARNVEQMEGDEEIVTRCQTWEDVLSRVCD